MIENVHGEEVGAEEGDIQRSGNGGRVGALKEMMSNMSDQHRKKRTDLEHESCQWTFDSHAARCIFMLESKRDSSLEYSV